MTLIGRRLGRFSPSSGMAAISVNYPWPVVRWNIVDLGALTYGQLGLMSQALKTSRLKFPWLTGLFFPWSSR